MPELPDVEVFRRILAATALGQLIEDATRIDRSILEGVSPERLRDALAGRRLGQTDRRGKWLLARVEREDLWLALHFGMTGRLVPLAADEELPSHTRLLLLLAGGRRLAFDCPRRFGRIALAPSPAALVAERELGPDALAIEEADFYRLLAESRGGLKALLMDQHRLAGVGNIYSDEVLFQARLHPERSAAELSRAERRRLYRSLRRVLEAAIERGADPEAFPGTWLTPRREAGSPCPRCGERLTKGTVAGRSGYWCPRCQSGT